MLQLVNIHLKKNSQVGGKILCLATITSFHAMYLATEPMCIRISCEPSTGTPQRYCGFSSRPLQ